MNQAIIKYYFKSPVAILAVLLFFTLSGCNSDNRNNSSFKNRFRSYEKLILDSFINYVHSISSPDFPLASFKSNSDLHKTPLYRQKIQTDGDLQFFPAILWQIYALTGKTKWKQMAENYSAVLYQDRIVEKPANVDAIQYVFLTRYLADQNQTNKSSLLDILSKYISDNEVNQELDCDLNTNEKVCLEQLLGNQLLFFASKETGDPVYAQLAQQNSEIVFKHYFQNTQFKKWYHDLANCKTMPVTDELTELNSEDLFHLAVIFYGFTILDNYKENERYHLLCLRLASFFSSILDDINAEGPSTKKQKGLIARKMDILSKTLVCLALKKLSDESENHYKEMAEQIFNQILDKLRQSDERKNGQYSSRLYYYLFEFLKQN